MSDWTRIVDHLGQSLNHDKELSLKHLLNDEKVQNHLENYLNQRVIPGCVEISGKNESLSNDYRRKGNQSYASHNIDKSIYFYRMALLYAPDDSESLPLAYGNRSAALFEIKKYHLSMADVDLALDHGYERFKCKKKLLIRKLQCLINLSRNDEAEKLFSEIEFSDSRLKDQLKARLKLAKELPHKMQPKHCNNESFGEIRLWDKYKYDLGFSLYNSKVEPSYSDKKGRFLKAKQDLKPGDVIIMERPFVKVMLYSYELLYCHHCCRELKSSCQTIVACKNCVNVLFCSLGCRQESWQQYHQYECSILPFLHQFGIGHLVLRIFLMTGIQTMLQQQQFKDLNQTDLEPFEKFNHDSLTLDYQALCSLKDHSEEFSNKDLQSYMITSIMIIKLLEHVRWIPADQVNQNIECLAKICLKHLCQVVTNAHAISGCVADGTPDGDDDDNDDDHDDDHCFSYERIATALYPAISLLNHSCDPNVVAIFEQGSLNLIRASKFIAAGQEINNCYGMHFSKYDYEERQNLLKTQYFFRCECSVCKEEEKGCQKEAILQKFQSISTGMLMEQLNQTDGVDYSPKELLLIGRMFDDLSYRQHHLLGNDDLARHYCQLSTMCVSRIYGEHSIELCHEMVKLSDLAWLTWSQYTFPATETIKVIRKTINLLDQFTTVVDASADDDQEDTCYFRYESKKLRQKLEALVQSKS